MDVVVNEIAPLVEIQDQSLSNEGNFYTHLLRSCGSRSKYPPVADLQRRLHSLDGRWLVASPIHWQASHNDAMIQFCGQDLQLRDSESRLWYKVFSDFFAADNMDTFYVDAHHWLLRCDGKPNILAPPVHALLHQSLMPVLSCLDESFYWQRLITETQMLMSAHDLNESRKNRPINGVWFWGDGELGQRSNTPILAQTRQLHKLAELLSTNVSEYLLSTSLSKKNILLLDKLTNTEHLQLKKQLSKNIVNWYWNNTCYQTKPVHWFKRLWSGSIDEN